MDKFSIRKLLCSDIEQITPIAYASFPERWADKDFAYFLAHVSGWCRGLFEGEKLIAYLLSLVVQGEMDLVSIATHTDRRKQGLAEKLMRHTLGTGEFSAVHLEVSELNAAAKNLYEKVGFKVAGRRKMYYRGVEDAILMRWTA